jgi:hypothetical protein
MSARAAGEQDLSGGDRRAAVPLVTVAVSAGSLRMA